MSKNISELSGRQGLENSLFDQYGRLVKTSTPVDHADLQKLADEFLIGTANTYGAISFYDFLRPENQGKKVYICNGTVCLCAGTQARLHQDLLEFFKEEEIGEMCCLGRCHENVAFQYNGKNYSGAQNGEIAEIIKNESGKKEKYRVNAEGTALLTQGTATAASFPELLSDLISSDAEKLWNEISLSGLRGRGGAGFPIAVKLKTCRDTSSDVRFVICNADEGDPGAFSDRYLLERKTCDVLFGMIVAAYVVNASWGVVYIRGEYPESVNIVQESIQSLRDQDLIGNNILGSSFSFDFKVIQAQGSYICGEETALINSIEGQRPEVRIRPPFPAQQGLFHKPTIVNNVETLAALPYIFKNGNRAFSNIGTEKSKGTKLLSLDSGFVRPGIYEVDMGTPLKQVVFSLGGGFRHEVKALHIGGPLGGIVPMHMVENLNIDFESFSNAGFLLGHASIVSIPADFPMIRYLEHLFQFASNESCGKCFPCRLGTKRAEELFHLAQQGSYKIDRQLIDDLLHTLEIGSLCAHGGGIPLPVQNILTYFESELQPYFKKRSIV
jgi:NADH-quinone oxidoreductase subunit F